jgi:hypothetical protein
LRLIRAACGSRNYRNKAIPSARQRDDIVRASRTLSEYAPQGSDLSSKVCFFDRNIRPDPGHERILVDHFAGALDQSKKNFKGTTSKRNGSVAFKQ